MINVGPLSWDDFKAEIRLMPWSQIAWDQILAPAWTREESSPPPTVGL